MLEVGGETLADLSFRSTPPRPLTALAVGAEESLFGDLEVKPPATDAKPPPRKPPGEAVSSKCRYVSVYLSRCCSVPVWLYMTAQTFGSLQLCRRSPRLTAYC